MTCERFANRHVARGDVVAPLRLRRDERLSEERLDAHVGRQRVATVVTGTADRGDAAGPTSRFVCLLESHDRAIFFQLLPAETTGDGDDPLAECSANTARRADVAGCLEGRLAVAERALQQALAGARARLADLEHATGGAAPASIVDASQSAWVGYRTRECARRAAQLGPGAGAKNVERACAVTLTLARTRELLRP